MAARQSHGKTTVLHKCNTCYGGINPLCVLKEWVVNVSFDDAEAVLMKKIRLEGAATPVER